MWCELLDLREGGLIATDDWIGYLVNFQKNNLHSESTKEQVVAPQFM